MKPDLEALRRTCPNVDERLVAEHLSRLNEAYFAAFDEREVCGHLARLTRLSPKNPIELAVISREGQVDCTVLAFDYPSEFSLITGVLTGMGFSILSGDIFTYAPAESAPARRRRGPGGRRAEAGAELLRRRRIIDHFHGTIDSPMPFDRWADELGKRMAGIIQLLENGNRDSTAKARHLVNEMVAGRLSTLQADSLPLLYPVQINIDNAKGPYTTLRVVAQDTPAFLYSLTNALSLRGIIIEHVRIRTTQGRVEDEVDILDSRGGRIEDPNVLNQIRLSVLLTKQFTYFLTKAPDPYTALCRFEQMVDDILRLPERGQWMDLLSSPRALQDLARLLGASDLIWEDLIRLQYEVLLPMLKPQVGGKRFSEPYDALRARLHGTLASGSSLEEKRALLNEFKDREIFLIDLDHILHSEFDPKWLAESLTRLAELVVDTAVNLVYEDLAARHGTPRTVGGLEAVFAVFGLGKLGGVALGYASDIELLFVYSDSGRTDGPQPTDNGEFYELLVKETARFIAAKREGIFHVDVRLRPYGKSGPWACSLESFCRYYGPGGPALSYERLALARLRAIGGDPDLGRQVERLRDEFIYSARSIDVTELRELREKQFTDKVKDDRYNAKFSPGALVDIEYDVQILQVMHGKDHPALRTPRIHEALAALSHAGVLGDDESRKLRTAYYFLRRLINGLRMLRGTARDLFLPPKGSDEYAHLARRMGYERGGDLEPEQQLHMEFETQTAVVRAFVEKHFGRDSLPGRTQGNVADLVLSETVPHDLSQKILVEAGFKNAERAYRNLRGLAGDPAQADLFAKLAVLACDTLNRMPDPDMALNNWERFVRTLPDGKAHYQLLLSQPRRLEILMEIFSGSQFLADTLVRNPEFLDWVTDPGNLQRLRSRERIEQDLAAFTSSARGHADWLNVLRSFRRREMLRIGTRDICLGEPIQEVMAELTALADVATNAALERVWLSARAEDTAGVRGAARHFCIMALGKLGGRELNYSSDIDLLGLRDDAARATGTARDGAVRRDIFEHAMEQVHNSLSAHTDEGYAYRVDLRLRPYGRAGHLVGPVSALVDYYSRKAELWEIQALLKMRPVAGNIEIGIDFLRRVRAVFLEKRSRQKIVDSIEQMRGKAVQSGKSRLLSGTDVKSGLGGLRDVEFMTQGLQLIYAPDHPELIEGNTVSALTALKDAGILPESEVGELVASYLFLRRVEHCLQILEDRQIHSLPRDPDQLTALAKRVMGVESESAGFVQKLDGVQKRVRQLYVERLLQGGSAG